jgi:desulfoferrodoxin-like iron-binding protein
MGVEKAGEQYKCNICGNEVTVTKVGGGELVCCGEAMEKISG